MQHRPREHSHIGTAFWPCARNARAHRQFARKTSRVTPAAVWFWEHQGVVPREEKLQFIDSALAVNHEFLLNGQTGPENPGEVSSALLGSSTHASAVMSTSLEDLIHAIESMGFTVSITSKLLPLQE